MFQYLIIFLVHLPPEIRKQMVQFRKEGSYTMKFCSEEFENHNPDSKICLSFLIGNLQCKLIVSRTVLILPVHGIA